MHLIRQLKYTLGKEDRMLWTIALILIILSVLGLVSIYTLRDVIHIVLIMGVFQRRRY